MGCSSCGGGKLHTINPNKDKANSQAPIKVVKQAMPESLSGKPVAASADPSRKVRLRYYGGGVRKSATGIGCSTCRGGKSNYVNTTSETITFVSDDEPSGLFRELVTVGHDIYVTEKQAEFLLTLTYINKGGQTVHKFKKVEE